MKGLLRIVAFCYATAVFAGEAAAADIYVATTGSDEADGSQAAPFATLPVAIAAANSAVDAGEKSVTIHVASGTYTGSGYVLDKAVTVQGAGAGETIFDGNGGYRVFSLMAPGATLKSLCVSNGAFTASSQQGAGVYMTAGLIEDCRIDSCGNTQNATYGGGVYASGGRINRTMFTGCKVHMMWGGNNGYGSALYMSNGAVCENSLFTGNAAVSYEINGNYKFRGGVVHLTGDKTLLVNCTVVKNDLKRGGDKNAGATKRFAGIVQRSSAKVINCVSYMNCPADFDAVETAYYDVVGAAGCFINSAWEKAIDSNSPVSPITIDEKAFAGFESGNYSPASYGSLHNAGSGTEYNTFAISATDITGVLRSQGASIDIGCFEVEETVFTAVVNADSYGILLGAESMFTMVAAGGSKNYKYKWNFGDGTEEVTTDQATVSHAYAAAGLYHAFVSVSDDGGTTWPVTPVLKSAIAVAPAHLYVNTASENPAFPYDTPEKAAATLSDALNCLTNTFEETLNMAVVDGVTIHVAKGTYMGVGYALAGDVTIVGEGAAETVFDGNGGYRVFSLMDPGATLKSLCVSNGTFTAQEQQGAGVYMEAGLIEDCRIDSCGNASIYTTYGGGVYASGGRINRTKFTGCKVHMTWNYKGWGSALYLCNGAACENSLLTGNAAVSYDIGGNYQFRGGVVHLTGDKTLLVNCTVVKNDLKRGGSEGADKRFAGIVQRSSAKVINCVAYMNCPADFDAAATTYGDVVGSADYFINSAWEKAINNYSPVSPLTIDETAFKNYANGNFVPKSGAALVNAGSDWETYLANGGLSTTDFAGAKRLSGKKLDIGCYEVSNGGFWLIVR